MEAQIKIMEVDRPHFEKACKEMGMPYQAIGEEHYEVSVDNPARLYKLGSITRLMEEIYNIEQRVK